MAFDRLIGFALVVVLAGCNNRVGGSDDEEGAEGSMCVEDSECTPYDQFPGVGVCEGGACTPTFSTCVAESSTTCEEACMGLGSTCAEAGCDGATYLLYFNNELCEEVDDPVMVEAACSEPIDWQFNGAARCCCLEGGS